MSRPVRGAFAAGVAVLAVGCGARSSLDDFGSAGSVSGSNATGTGAVSGSTTPVTGTVVASGTVVDSGKVGIVSEGDGGEDSASAAAPTCTGGSSDAGDVAPSCAAIGPGRTNCGACNESCCTSLEVTGGTYYRTYDPLTGQGEMIAATLAPDGGPGNEADPATVSRFRLDKYLVTVGRFRQFVKAWNRGNGYTPPAGSGKHVHLNNGNGLNANGGGYEPGWVSADNVNIAPTNAHLGNGYGTWTASPGSRENLPINFANWWEAYAFCIWDGGFLPSDAESEDAAAGGNQQREYPWSSTDPGTANQYAIYSDGTESICYYPSLATQPA
jgi:formylglycine-generating enzyme required for sulfatase activity